jgi:dipeptidyl aminopeptidase/acylaminoacyl peptidase
MRPAVRVVLLALPLSLACRHLQEAPPPAEPQGPAVASAAPSASSALPIASASGPYSGHGTESIAPEVLEKYRPQPVPSELGRRIEALIDIRGPSVGRMSPDGKSLYFGWSITGINQVWKLDGVRAFPRQLTAGEDATGVVDITPDGAWLVVQRDRKGEENPGLYLQPAAGGPLVLIQHVPKVQTLFEKISPDSKYVYFAANDAKPDSYTIYRWDIAKGVREVVFDQDGLWHVDDLRADGHMLMRKSTGSLSAEYSDWDPAQKQLTPLFGQGEKDEYEARYGAKTGEILVLTNKAGEYRRLYAWTGPGSHTALGEDVQQDVASFSIDDKRTRIVYTTNEGGYHRPHAIDARTYKPITLPKLPEADQVFFGPTTPDGRFTTLGVDDGRHPLQGYVLDWATGKLETWHAPSAPEIDTTRFARAHLETYKAQDGTDIPVFVRRPDKCATDPCAVIMAFHGGPEGQSLPGFNVGAQMFVDAGFVYAEPNVRGSEGYGKTWSHADDGAKRLAIITDIEDASKWARNAFTSGGTAPKIGVYGGSYGGYSVLMAMTMFAGDYDAGVDIVGISDLRTFLRNTAPYRRILRISEYGDPDADADALAKLSPMTYIDRVKAPLMIVQGASDPRVPAGESIQIHDALQVKGVPCDLTIFPDEGHGPQKRENRVYMYARAIGFFKEHLLGTHGPG